MYYLVGITEGKRALGRDKNKLYTVCPNDTVCFYILDTSDFVVDYLTSKELYHIINHVNNIEIIGMSTKDPKNIKDSSRRTMSCLITDIWLVSFVRNANLLKLNFYLRNKGKVGSLTLPRAVEGYSNFNLEPVGDELYVNLTQGNNKHYIRVRYSYNEFELMESSLDIKI